MIRISPGVRMTQLKTKSLIDQYIEIKSSNLMQHVKVLAADNMRGRMPGDIGYRRAMDYCIDFFKNHGLQPAFPDDSFEQPFTMETCCVTDADVTLTMNGEETRKMELGHDYVCRALTGDGDVSGELVFVGYCCTDDDFNELENVDLQGKIAVSFKHPPPWIKPAKPMLPREKAHILKKHGAVGLVIVPNPNRAYPDRLSVSWVEKGEYIPGFPLLVLADHQADTLFGSEADTLAGIQYNIDHNRTIHSRPLPARMNIRLDTIYKPEDTSWNVAAILPGSDPELKHDTVLLGAHLDHVGIQGETTIFNGAQDNASGVAAVLEMARIFADGPAPRRSIAFALFGAEEAGLLGSIHYANNPPHSMEDTVAMLNLDCMGAGTGCDMRGRKAYPELFELLDRMNEDFVNLKDSMADHPAGGADAKPFEDAGVPNMYFVSSSAYRHLHMASDTTETLNPPLFEAISRLAYLTASELASRG